MKDTNCSGQRKGIFTAFKHFFISFSFWLTRISKDEIDDVSMSRNLKTRVKHRMRSLERKKNVQMISCDLNCSAALISVFCSRYKLFTSLMIAAPLIASDMSCVLWRHGLYIKTSGSFFFVICETHYYLEFSLITTAIKIFFK